MRYRLQRHDGTDCSATMVPITVLRMVPIQRYRQYSQPVHTFFSHFCTYLFYIEGNGKEGKVHGEFVYSKMSETFIVHIAMY